MTAATDLHNRRTESSEVLVIGHLAAGNLGDEMMLRGLLSALRVRGHEVVVLRSRPTDWCDPRPDEPGVRYVPRLGLARASRLRRPLLLCGGTHFHDADAGQPRIRHLVAMGLLSAQLLATRVAGGRFHLVSVGLGPFRSRLGRGVSRLVLRVASTVTVRDEASRSWARQLGRLDVPLVDDLALGCDELRTIRPSSGGPVVVVPVPDPAVPGGTLPSVAEVAEVVDEVGGHDGVALLSINGVEANLAATAATAAAAGVADRTPSPGPDVLERALETIACSDIVVSARFHGVLAAYALGRPVVAWPYHPKVAALAHELGIPTWTGDRPFAEVRDEALRARPTPDRAAAPLPDPVGLRTQLDEALA